MWQPVAVCRSQFASRRAAANVKCGRAEVLIKCSRSSDLCIASCSDSRAPPSRFLHRVSSPLSLTRRDAPSMRADMRCKVIVKSYKCNVHCCTVRFCCRCERHLNTVDILCSVQCSTVHAADRQCTAHPSQSRE